MSQIGEVRAFNFNEISGYPVDKEKIYAHFGRDVFFVFLPILLAMGSAVFLMLTRLDFTAIFGAALLGFGFGKIAQDFYRYPAKSPKKATTLELMEDVYVSPVRGKKRLLDGKIARRGIPGFIFSEDMMFEDKTGLIYLQYEGLIPLLSNLIFALSKVDKLVGKEGRCEGWFFRGLAPRLELNFVEIREKKFRSWIKF